MTKFFDWNKPFSKYIEDYTKENTNQDSSLLVLTNQNCLDQNLELLKESHVKTLNELILENIESNKTAANSFIKYHSWKHVLAKEKESEFKKYINSNFELNNDNLINFANYCSNISGYIDSNLLSYEKIIETHKTSSLPNIEKWKFISKLHQKYLEYLDFNNYIDINYELNNLDKIRSKDLNISIYGCQFLNTQEISFLEKLDKENKLEICIFCPEELSEGFNKYGDLNTNFWQDLALETKEDNLIFTENINEEITKCIQLADKIETDIIPLNVKYINRLRLEFDYRKIDYCSFWTKHLINNKLLLFIKDLIDYELENSTYNFLKVVKNVIFRRISAIDFKKLNSFLEFKIPQNIDLRLAEDFIETQKIKEILNSIKNDSIEILVNNVSKLADIKLSEKDLKSIKLLSKQLDKIESDKTQSDTIESSTTESLTTKNNQKLQTIIDIISNTKQSFSYNKKNINLLSFKDSIYNNSKQKILLGFNKKNFPKSSPSYLHKIIEKEHNIIDKSKAQSSYLYSFLQTKNYKILCSKIDINDEKTLPSNYAFRESAKKSARIIKNFYSDGNSNRSKNSISINSLKLNLPKPIKTDIKNISISSLKDYLICPYLFYVKHILKLDSTSFPVLEMNSKVFGTLAHSIIEEFGDNQTPEMLDAYYDKTVKEHFQENTSSIVKLQLLQLKNRIYPVVSLQKQLNMEGWLVYKKEDAFSQKLTHRNKTITLSGRIDRIDVNHEEKIVRIIDFKTSDKILNLKKTIDIENCLDFQLPIYANSIKNEFPQYAIEVAYASFSKSESKIESKELSTEELELYKKESEKITNLIIEQKFWPPSYENWGRYEKLFFVYENQS